MKKLIVNADDFGYSLDVNRGIIEGFKHGIITSTTMLATFPAFNDAVKLAKSNPKLGIGLHLNLTCGNSLLSLPTITNNGRFDTGIFLKSVLKKIALGEVYKELDAQIKKVKSTGIEITHIDGHRHIDIFPGIVDVVVRLAKEHGIKKIRMPRCKNTNLSLNLQLPKKFVVDSFSKKAEKKFRASGLKMPNALYGFHETGSLTLKKLFNIVKAIGPGTSELFCHPGFYNIKTPGSFDKTRPGDLETVTSQKAKKMLARYKIELISYREL